MKRILSLAVALLCLASCKSQGDFPFADAKWIGSSESVIFCPNLHSLPTLFSMKVLRGHQFSLAPTTRG